MDKLELIKENSYLKYAIISLIEQIPNGREYKELKKYLKEIVSPTPEVVVPINKLKDLIDNNTK